MKNGIKTIQTNLYELISAMLDEHGSNNSRISKRIKNMTESGEIRWQIKQNPIFYKAPQSNHQKVKPC